MELYAKSRDDNKLHNNFVQESPSSHAAWSGFANVRVKQQTAKLIDLWKKNLGSMANAMYTTHNYAKRKRGEF